MPGDVATTVRLAPAVGRSLDGTTYHLPSRLPAELTLVVLAFRQRQQPDVDRWIELAIDLGVTASPFAADLPLDRAVVEVPVLGRRYLPARRMIDGGMARGIGDPVALARTITVYTDVATYQRRCGLPTRGEVNALLARQDGSVSFHAVGPPGPTARASLRQALTEAT